MSLYETIYQKLNESKSIEEAAELITENLSPDFINVATTNNHFDMVKLLISKGLSVNNKSNYFNEELQKNKTEYKNLTDQLKNNDILTKEAHDKSWEQNEKIFRLQQIVGDQSPILQNRRKIIYQNNRKKYNIAKSDDFPINNSSISISQICRNIGFGELKFIYFASVSLKHK